LPPIEAPLPPGRLEEALLDGGERVYRYALPLGFLDWQVVAEVPRSVLLRDLFRFRRRVLLGATLLFFLLAVASTVASKRLVRPIHELVAAAQRLGEGDLDRPIRSGSTEELARLASEMDRTRQRLRDLYTNLEQRVREREEELRKAQFQILHQEKMASLGLMAAGIAHEIGNPLASISSLVQVMQRRVKDPALQDHLDDLQEQVKRITRIVRELVDFSRPKSAEPQWVDVNEVVRSAVGLVRFDRRAKDVRFETDLAEELPPVRCVPDQLQQVLFNLLVNALDAVEGKGRRIVVRSWAEEDSVAVSVADDGIGIPEAIRQKIFEPFFTTKPVGRGTGLGLTVSYGIVRNFGGTLDVESREGQGSTFTVRLPLSRVRGANGPRAN
jgi:signal transduction histidine kinase